MRKKCRSGQVMAEFAAILIFCTCLIALFKLLHGLSINARKQELQYRELRKSLILGSSGE